jgi:SAM-dependent methyltransferase
MTSFDDRARTWDTPERRARAEAVAEVIRASVPLSHTTRTIEIGAGTGLLGLALAPDLGELVLSDPSAGMLEVIGEKLTRGELPNVSAARLDLLADPPPTPAFDLAVSLLMLHHLEDTPRALRAIRDLLVPGGRLALADLDAEDGTFHAAGAEGVHHQGFDQGAVVALAREAGFDDVATRPAGELERDGRRYALFLLTARRP